MIENCDCCTQDLLGWVTWLVVLGEMEGGSDFIEYLGADVSIKILTRLENPSDLVHVSAVSSSWRQLGELFNCHLLSFARVI